MASLLNTNRVLLFSISKQINASLNQTAIRSLATHWNPKFKKLRKEKFTKVNLLEDFDNNKKNVKRGIAPPGSFFYKPINITSSKEIFDSYVPPEGDGKSSLFSKDFANRAVEKVSKTFSKKVKHSRLIKKFDSLFDETLFAEQAQQLYIDAHNAMMNRDPENMLNYVTEHALSKMYQSLKFKTLRWKWINSLEEPVVKHLVTREMLVKDDIYAQVTVRIHSKQTVALYDRFGRLAFGSETLEQDVLEYVVFEKHITSMYGNWRLHDKIVPNWLPPKTPIIRSYVLPTPLEVNEDLEKKIKSKFKKDDEHLEKFEEKA